MDTNAFHGDPNIKAKYLARVNDLIELLLALPAKQIELV